MLSVNQHCQGSKVAAACPTGLFHPGSPEEQLQKNVVVVFILIPATAQMHRSGKNWQNEKYTGNNAFCI